MWTSTIIQVSCIVIDQVQCECYRRMKIRKLSNHQTQSITNTNEVVIILYVKL